MPETSANQTNKGKFKGRIIIYDAVQFVIDDIAEDFVTGHFVLMKNGKEEHRLPGKKVAVNQAVQLTKIAVRTRLKCRF
jgi:hypothetical protein